MWANAVAAEINTFLPAAWRYLRIHCGLEQFVHVEKLTHISGTSEQIDAAQ